MREELLVYYEQELRFLRTLARDFAEKYPEEAGRLLLESTRSQDPHVERLIEAFALLAARVRLKVDDDFPEITDALLGILYPHYLSPVPSMSIAQMQLDPSQGKAAEGVPVPRGAELTARPVDGVRCRFRSAYPVRLWPIEVASTAIVPVSALEGPLPPEAASALLVTLRGVSGPIGEFTLDPLTFFLDADSGVLHKLYELFFLDAVGLWCRRGAQGPGHVEPTSSLRPLGLDEDEGLLDYPIESFIGYRLLQEYFAFPEKYLFAELRGLDRAPGEADASEFQLAILLRKPLSEVDVRVVPQNLRLGCTPIVNLFSMRTDPIRISHRTYEYRATPDQRALQAYEVYRVEDVSSTTPGEARRVRYEPFYAIRHGFSRDEKTPFWVSSRRASSRKGDEGTDVYVSLVDESFEPATQGAEVLHVRALCTNRDLPARLAFGDPAGDLFLEGRSEIERIVCLRKPTPSLRAPARSGGRWRIVSHLALNHLSLGGDLLQSRSEEDAARSDGLRALREILKLYDYQDSAVTRNLVEGLVGVKARRVVRRIQHPEGATFARGLEVELELDEDRYTTTGALLFATVLERFLGLYASVNSFTQSAVHTRQRAGELKRWPPRAGELRIL